MQRPGWQLRAYRTATRAVPLVAPLVLRRRLRRGKEDPQRWTEKLGKPGLDRPEGRLIWMHAVGLGEVMALRGLIAAVQELDPSINVLVTSTARSGADVFAIALPPRTQHQFLPLDAPQYLRRFLDHWQPDLSIWSEQDLWPGAIAATDALDVPLALVNGRMDGQSIAKRRRAGGLYADVLGRFALVSAQDDTTADHLRDLGAQAVRTDGPMKAAGPALPVDADRLDRLKAGLGGRPVWLLASSHAADEDIAWQHVQRDRLLIIAPRDPARGDQIEQAAKAAGHSVTRQSSVGDDIAGDIHIADSFGQMGLWYRLADRALIGGTFGDIEGHNPWEAAALGCAILHGPRIANFANDYRILSDAQAACPVTRKTLEAALIRDLSATAQAASALVDQARTGIRPLVRDLLGLLR